MSRTKRDPYIRNLCLRHPQTLNEMKGNQAAVEELLDEGYTPRSREVARTSWKVIANAYDDVCIAALDEVIRQ